MKWSWGCSPKDGGLGFRKLREGNVAAILKLLWALSRKADSLWVKWVHTYIIEDHDIWIMGLPSDVSWTIRKIFQFRGFVNRYFDMKLGMGLPLSFGLTTGTRWGPCV